MKKYLKAIIFLGTILAIIATGYLLAFVACRGWQPFPISIWDGKGEIVAWYEMNGHHVFHVKLYGDGQLSAMQVVRMIEVGLGLAGDAVMPEHGLYMVVERVDEERLAFAIGLTHDAILAWPETITEEVMPYDLVSYIDWQTFSVNLRWPAWIEDERIKVFGYAWLVGMVHSETHPWYPELYYSKPGPFDSGFMIEPESG